MVPLSVIYYDVSNDKSWFRVGRTLQMTRMWTAVFNLNFKAMQIVSTLKMQTLFNTVFKCRLFSSQNIFHANLAMC